MATNRAAIRRMMGPREGFTDELSPKERAEMRARSRRVALRNQKDKTSRFLKDHGALLIAGAAALALVLYKRHEKQKKAAVVGSIMLHG